MGLTRERKVFVGMLALAGAALLVDQGILRPKSASAAAPSPASAGSGLSVLTDVVEQVKSAATGADPLDAAGVDISAKLDQLRATLGQASGGEGGGLNLADAFTPPESWLPKPAEEAQSGAQATTETRSAGVAAALELSAVLPSAKGGSAIINGQAVKVGQPIPGQNAWTLAAVRRDAVLLTRGQDKRIIRLNPEN